jgi:membrane-bound metal-dependent hydrolase YbcI (DUF457 family)
VAYVLHKLNRKLSLPGLIVGSMFPDLEIPIMILLFGYEVPYRLLLHSLLGVLTIGTLLSVALTTFLYPNLICYLFRINQLKMKKKCRLTFELIFSCFLGNLSHVLVDVINHPYNPIFWPLLQPNETPSPICSLLGGMENASLILHPLLLILFITSLPSLRENIWEQLLMGE